MSRSGWSASTPGTGLVAGSGNLFGFTSFGDATDGVGSTGDFGVERGRTGLPELPGGWVDTGRRPATKSTSPQKSDATAARTTKQPKANNASTMGLTFVLPTFPAVAPTR